MEKPWYRKWFGNSPKPALADSVVETNPQDAEGQFNLGLKFSTSAGHGHDDVQAAQWYHKAADQSHAMAQFNLGMMYAKGQGVAQDNGQAVMWFLKAATQGDPAAQFNLGLSQHRASVNGLSPNAPESRIEAYKWFHLAAAQGYRGADSARSSLILVMSRADVTIGISRAAAFTVIKSTPVSA